MGYKLQRNGSPHSATSDQRAYKGTKRVDIFDENDIKQMHAKKERQKLYSQTPSPPQMSKKKMDMRLHCRNLTRNCEGIYTLQSNEEMEEGMHRQTMTKCVDVMNSFNDSSISVLTTGTNDGSYFDNLRLKQIKKKSVDKERLKLLLQNLPCDAIIDESSSEDAADYVLHTDEHQITFI